MKPREEKITEFVHSPAAAWLLSAIGLAAMYGAYATGAVGLLPVPKGLGLDSPSQWFASPGLSMLAAMAVNVALAALMILINSRYNLLRDITKIYAGIFLLMQAALPLCVCAFGGGLLAALIIGCSIFGLYAIYNKPAGTRSIFLIFFLLATGALTQYAFVFYIPIFLMGCAQMRVFSTRSFLAALLGIVTPAWIGWAFGILDYSAWPGLEFANPVAQLSPARQAHFYATAAFTVALGVTLCIVNLVKVFSYNSRSRSYNGFIALLLIATCLLMAVDFTNIPFYTAALNLCVAYQAGQFFVINIKKRGYIMVLGVAAAYIGLFVWWLAIAVH